MAGPLDIGKKHGPQPQTPTRVTSDPTRESAADCPDKPKVYAPNCAPPKRTMRSLLDINTAPLPKAFCDFPIGGICGSCNDLV